MDLVSNKVLITGIDSFTGKHLSAYLKSQNYDVYGTTYKDCDITKKEDIEKALSQSLPDSIIHLAGISFPAHGNNEDFYKVNTIGTINILETLIKLNIKPKKIILASSATVYGNQHKKILDESLSPIPTSHYGASKYAMETLAKNFFDKLNIIITRPFNYTGVGQEKHFLIPKIVLHYKLKKKTIELGNLQVYREFNSVDYVCEIYKKLLESDEKSKILNISSNKPIKILSLVETMNKIANYNIEVKVSPAFLRKNEIESLSGDTTELFKTIGDVKQKDLNLLLREMYEV